jgi:CNT family concentrative nucleoside transporter
MAAALAERLGPDRALRAGALGGAVALGVIVYLFRHVLPPRGAGAIGIVCFILVVAGFSSNLRAVNWRVVLWGLALQFGLALFILRFSIAGWRPGYALFSALAAGVQRFLQFTSAGAEFVFGGLANQEAMSKVFNGGFVFAFMGLPAIIFVSSVFAVLYHLRVLPLVVRMMAIVMMRLMRTSGAETLAAAANVFMGNAEAPLIVKPYIARMTQSELLAVMAGGFATISGGMMAVYISLGADPVAILTTSVMAAPAALYLSKIMWPETGEPETRGQTRTEAGPTHANVIDAAASGAVDGTMLAINIAAVLIAFLSLLALIDYLLGLMIPGLSLSAIFARVFAPAAMLMGVPLEDVPEVADLLGIKLVANEFVSYVKLTTEYRDTIGPMSYSLATYALTGFASFGSVGIALGAMGAMAPARRGDLARLSGRALLVGYVTTLINASIAAMLS